MDHARWDTGQILAYGVLGRSAPVTEIPEGREQWRTTYTDDGDMDTIDTAAAEAALEAGKLIHTNEYYGLVYGWKAGDGKYRGTLLQYRNVTENPTFATAAELVEWFAEISRAVIG